MKNGKKYLVIGIIIGLVLSFFYFHFFAPRYEIKKSGMTLVKTDRWTGRSWRFVDNNWQKMMDMDQDWEQIDRTLLKAIKIPYTQVDTDAALVKLKESYPLLKDIPDNELMERIKYVYSRQVVGALYLNDFMNTAESGFEDK